jgi:hypothetical protein
MRNPLLHNLLIDRRCVSSHDGRSRPVRQSRCSPAHPSLHSCSLRPYRSIATPNVWIPTAKSMKQNTGKGSPTAANDRLRGAYGSFRFRDRPLPMCLEQSHWLTPRKVAAPIEEFVDLAARRPAGLVSRGLCVIRGNSPQRDSATARCRLQHRSGGVHGWFHAVGATPVAQLREIASDLRKFWCPRQDSNLRPSAPEADALSPELRGRTQEMLRQRATTD